MKSISISNLSYIRNTRIFDNFVSYKYALVKENPK